MVFIEWLLGSGGINLCGGTDDDKMVFVDNILVDVKLTGYEPK